MPDIDAATVAPANPAALGLVGFGLTTILLSLINAGVLPAGGEGVVIPMALAYGGLIQIIAGLMEFRVGNTFGMTATPTGRVDQAPGGPPMKRTPPTLVILLAVLSLAALACWLQGHNAGRLRYAEVEGFSWDEDAQRYIPAVLCVEDPGVLAQVGPWRSSLRQQDRKSRRFRPSSTTAPSLAHSRLRQTVTSCRRVLPPRRSFTSRATRTHRSSLPATHSSCSRMARSLWTRSRDSRDSMPASS